MDYSNLDKVRREVTPLQLDTVEAFARGKLTRRAFIKRATLVGLSMGSISAVIAACGGTTPSASGAATSGASAAPSAGASGAAGGTIRVACQRPGGPLDPVAMVDLASYGLTAQSFEFLCTLNAEATDIAPGLALTWTPNDDNSVWTFALRQNVTWHDGTPFTLGRRRRHDGAPRHRGQLRSEGRHRGGLGGRHRPQYGDLQPGQRQRQLPVSRVGLQRPIADHPRGLRRRHHAGRKPERDRRLEARQLRHRLGRQVRAKRRMVGRTDATRQRPNSRSSTTPARW